MLDRGLTAKVDRFLDIVATAREVRHAQDGVSAAGFGRTIDLR